MSPQRADIRRILMVFGIFNLIPLGIIFMFGKWDTVILACFLINAGMLLWLVIDAVVTLRLLREAGLLDDPMSRDEMRAAIRTRGVGAAFCEALSRSMKDTQRMEKMLRLFLVQGVTWKYLKSIIKQKEEMSLEAERAERERANWLKELEKRKVVEERERREARRGREAAELLQTGVALGIPEAQMQSLLAESLEQARSAIAQRRLEEEVLSRARRHSCAEVVAPLVQSGRVAKAETTLAKVVQVIECASGLGVEQKVRESLEGGDLPLAERVIAEAAKKREYQDFRGRLEARINKLPQSKRPEARAILARLDDEPYGARPFRKVLHELERALGR